MTISKSTSGGGRSASDVVHANIPCNVAQAVLHHAPGPCGSSVFASLYVLLIYPLFVLAQSAGLVLMTSAGFAQDGTTPNPIADDASRTLVLVQDSVERLFEHGEFVAAASSASALLIFPAPAEQRSRPIVQGILISKSNKGEWSYPAFYEMLNAEKDLINTRVLVLMNERSLKVALTQKPQFRKNLRIASGADVATAPDADDVDVLTFKFTDGKFEGFALKGLRVRENAKRNRAFYGVSASTRDIVRIGKLDHPQGDNFRDAFAFALEAAK